MKHILLAIFVLFAAQPLQASYCGMCDGQEPGDRQQSSMYDGAMTDHSNGHQMDSHDDNGQDMGCCDSDSDNSDDGCKPLSHCGASTISFAVIDASTPDMRLNTRSQQLFTRLTGVLSRTSSPPFRPPIA